MLKVEALNIGQLYLHPTPFAKGGEGLLYEIKAPKAYQKYVAKLYYSEKRTKEREKKMLLLFSCGSYFCTWWPDAKVSLLNEGDMPKVTFAKDDRTRRAHRNFSAYTIQLKLVFARYQIELPHSPFAASA